MRVFSALSYRNKEEEGNACLVRFVIKKKRKRKEMRV